MKGGVGVGEKREKGREGGEGLPAQKLVRAQEASSPFRLVAPASATPPGGPTLFYGGIYDAYEAARVLQPLPSPFASSGVGIGVSVVMGGAASAALRGFSFTPTQWRELQRQAMIYKHLVASVPIPAELLLSVPPASFSDSPPHLFPRTLVGRDGGACVNVRFGNGVDPEPGRCRRTDGKKWRCSRDVAPGQKYCERHIHRGRPRSRKPVELHHKNKPAPITVAAAGGSLSTIVADNPPARTTTSSTLSQHFPVHSTGLKFPFLSMDPNRHSDWMKDDGEEMGSAPQWELLQSKIGSRSNTTTTILQHYNDEFNLNYTDLNDQCFPLLNPSISSLEEGTMGHHREPPRRFIDAWSTETLEAATTTDGKSSLTFARKLPLSTLSLSMCGSVEEDADQVQMGLGLGDAAVKLVASSWMAPGPLGEALQSSNGTSPHNVSGSSKDSGGGGLMNLMGKGSCGSQESIPQDSPTRLASSPSGVLQKALVSLSDSSCSSSPTFTAAAASRAEFTLQWMNQSK